MPSRLLHCFRTPRASAIAAFLRRLAAGLGPAALVLAVLASARPSGPPSVPAIVFVSRQPLPAKARGIPGFGPLHRASATGGRLLVRERNGTIRPLLAAGALFDVADPAVSFDAKRVAFAGTPHPDSAWRIYLVALDGSGLRALTGGSAPTSTTRSSPRAGDPAAARLRADDLDPCWLSDDVVCFASTRGAWRSQYGNVPVTNLWTMRVDGGGLAQLTADRNGAEEPTLDPVSGHVLYSRWWYNAYRPSRLDPSGITSDASRALPGDSVNQWQVVDLALDGGSFRLGAGQIPSRRGTMAYQPAIVNGEVIAIAATHLGLWPAPGPTALCAFPRAEGSPRKAGAEAIDRGVTRLAGAVIAEDSGDPYRDARGLAAPSACSPAGLPDGRIVFALDPGARGDFGLWCIRPDGSGLAPLVDLPGTLELDPAPIVRRPVPVTLAAAASTTDTFVFFCRNLFASGALDSRQLDAPTLDDGLRLRFFEVRSRPDRALGDTAILVREVPVAADGSVRAEGLAAHTPMFEQLVDREGHPVSGSSGPAHVRGMNFGAPGSTLRCVGCHAGHSVLPAGEMIDARSIAWIDASTSATVTASSALPGTVGARGAVDRRTRGPATEVTWIADSADPAWLRLAWNLPLELGVVRLHAPRRDRREGTDLTIRRGELGLFRDGREIERRALPHGIDRSGTSVDCGGAVVDAIELRIFETRGRVAHRRLAGLAEIETLARIADPTRVRGASAPRGTSRTAKRAAMRPGGR